MATSFLNSYTNTDKTYEKLHSTIPKTMEKLNYTKTKREFYQSFSRDPAPFLRKWIVSQNRDLTFMTALVGCSEIERRAHYYWQPWVAEAVKKYISIRRHRKGWEKEARGGDSDYLKLASAN